MLFLSELVHQDQREDPSNTLRVLRLILVKVPTLEMLSVPAHQLWNLLVRLDTPLVPKVLLGSRISASWNIA